MESEDGGSSGRGIARLLVEFKSPTGTYGAPGWLPGTVRLTVRILEDGQELALEASEAQKSRKGKGWGRVETEEERKHLLTDPLVLPCRFSGIAVTLFTLGQLAGIACSTAAGTDATSAYRALKRLGQSISRLEDESGARTNGLGLVERLRKRLRNLRKVDAQSTRKSKKNNKPATRLGAQPERVERSGMDLFDAEERVRWLPVL